MDNNSSLDFFDKNINVVQTVVLVVSLAFLTYQTYEQTNALEQQEYGSILMQQQDIFKIQSDSSDLYVKALYSAESLTPSEIWKITEIIYLRLELLERMKRAHENGIIPEKDLNDEYADTQIYLNTPVGRKVWPLARVDYDPESDFVKSIDDALAKGDVDSDDVFLKKLIDVMAQLRSQ